MTELNAAIARLHVWFAEGGPLDLAGSDAYADVDLDERPNPVAGDVGVLLDVFGGRVLVGRPGDVELPNTFVANVSAIYAERDAALARVKELELLEAEARSTGLKASEQQHVDDQRLRDELAALRSRIGAARVYCDELTHDDQAQLDLAGVESRPVQKNERMVIARVAGHILGLLDTPRPAQWPPQPGDEWRDQKNQTWLAVLDDDITGVQLTRAIRPNVTDTDSPDWVWDTYGPLTLVHRPGQPTAGGKR